jgi:cysteinyl-tRNA synthetase
MFDEADIVKSLLVGIGVEVMDGDPLGWDWKLDV